MNSSKKAPLQQRLHEWADEILSEEFGHIAHVLKVDCTGLHGYGVCLRVKDTGRWLAEVGFDQTGYYRVRRDHPQI